MSQIAFFSLTVAALLAADAARAGTQPDATGAPRKVQKRQKVVPKSTKASLGAKPVLLSRGAVGSTHKKIDEEQQPEADEEEDEEKSLSVGGELDLNSRYLWRGIAFSQGPVLQPAAWLSWRGWTVAVGANLMLSGEASPPLTTVVPTVAYLLSKGDFELNTELMVIWDTTSMPDNPTAIAAGLEGSWTHDIFELGTHHYVNLLTEPGAYYGELAADLNAESGPWFLSFGLHVGLGSPTFRNLYLDDVPTILSVLDGSLRLQYSWAMGLYASIHAELFTLLNSPLSADTPRTLGNAGLSFGAEI